MNPYAPRTGRGVPIELPIARFRRLGATDATIADARRRWAGLSSADRAESVDAMAAQTDEEMAAEIADAQDVDVYPDALTGVPDGADIDPPPEDGTVAQILAWVADTPERAARMLATEEADGRPRKGLVRELRKIARLGG